ncbi:hypothetical protein ACPYO6_07665 [Georgenia sp. Z1344]|uniref:hypothetical protein n=1 Tax=Georgenia sp. Z1344 TaxID=3416706 RepID=UPI003CEA6DEC
MSNSYGQDGWGQSPQIGYPSWGQSDGRGYGAQTAYGQSPADPGVPVAPQYGGYAPQGQNAQFGQPQYGQQPFGGYAPQGQNAQFGQPQYGQPQLGQPQYGQPGGFPPYPNQDGNPFAAPPSYGMGGPGGHVERPGMLKAACIILWVGGALAVLVSLVFFATDPAEAGIYGIENSTWKLIWFGVLMASALDIVLPVFVWKGSNAARIAVTIFIGLSTLVSLGSFANGADAGSGIGGIAVSVLVLVFLWQRSSTEYMAYRKRLKDSGRQVL